MGQHDWTLWKQSERKGWLFSHVRLLAIPWTVARQAPLSMGFSRQECWSAISFSREMNLSNPGIKPKSPALQVNSLPSEPPGKPSPGFSLTHKRGRESCCKVPNILPTLRVHPIPWKVSSTCVYSVYCQSAHIQGGCCSQEQSVRHWRWDAKGQVWRALDGRSVAVPTIPGERGYWARLDHSLVMCDGHTTGWLLCAGLCADHLWSGNLPLRPERGMVPT